MSIVKCLEWTLPVALMLLLNACGKSDTTDVRMAVADREVICEYSSKIYFYDEFGRLVKEDLGNGRYIEYTYDKGGSFIKQTLIEPIK